MRFARLLLFTWLVAATPAVAAEFGGIRELYVAPTISLFQWEEYGGGTRLLREEGPLFGVAGGIRVDLLRTSSGQAFTLTGVTELYGGVVSYDGHTQSSTFPKQDNRPFTTDVSYVGGHGGFDLGWMFPLRATRLSPLIGLDYRAWMRDLQGGSTVDSGGVPFQVSGSTEFWQNTTLCMGLRWNEIPLGGGWSAFGEGAAVYPFYTSNRVDVAGYGTLTIKPEGEWSARGELGVRNKSLRFAVTYEGLRFGRSPTVYIAPSKGYYQPESSGDLIGFSVGYCFR
jgi:hypothetical protein